MATIKINIDDEMGVAHVDASYEDFDDLISSVALITQCLIYRGLQDFSVPAEPEAEEGIKLIKELLCSIISEDVSLDDYKEFCKEVTEDIEENRLYKFMEDLYEEWLTTVSRTEEELISLCREESLDLCVSATEEGNIDLQLVEKSGGEIIEKLKTIKIEEENELYSNVVEQAAAQTTSILVVLGDHTFEEEQDNYFRKLRIDDIHDSVFEAYNTLNISTINN